MKRYLTLLFCAFATISGCSRDVPKCGAQESKDLVIEIADQEMAAQMGAETAELLSYELLSVRTTQTNPDTGAHQCEADLAISSENEGKINELSISYTVEMTDDGNELYVTVYGL